jgi:hypothetical protein
MRWYGQLVVVAVLGGAGYGAWFAHQQGYLAQVPVLGEMAAKVLPRPGAAPAGRGRAVRGRLPWSTSTR